MLLARLRATNNLTVFFSRWVVTLTGRQLRGRSWIVPRMNTRYRRVFDLKNFSHSRGCPGPVSVWIRQGLVF